mmetsp:Transcript_27336/g.28431  ORF Transcript_27336/g.28431 Transcript_27336/m.28431 type:complete len:482 (-) Transcript_27336:49-1494(-)
MFKIGIGPSSSHTLGPMKAAKDFLVKATNKGVDLSKVRSMKTDLYGSLALTGKGHHTDKAVILGMMGEDPVTVDTSTVYKKVSKITKEKKVQLLGTHQVGFKINFLRSQILPYHTNGLKFTLLGEGDQELINETYYSIGGGFILSDEETKKESSDHASKFKSLPFQFKNATELFWLSETNKIPLNKLIMENEKVFHQTTEKEIKERLDVIWSVMNSSIKRGLSSEGVLPGPLELQRRAPSLFKKKVENNQAIDPMFFMNWINVHAMAVSEENASGGQVVTSPTNGSAGVIPAVASYYNKFYADKHPNKLHDLLTTAGAIGGIFKLNSTISGAEGGCQAEIGVSSSMAAAGLTCALGGTNSEIEAAAESAMEHFIGMTCDPIGGLVQIPCIERNGVGAVKAINACSLALSESINRRVSLDRIVNVMKKTGDDMKTKYKETSKGGLAKEFFREYKKEKGSEGYDEEAEEEEETVKLFLPETLC